MTEALLIRADASPEVGNGHVMRCRALAHAWQNPALMGGAVTMAMAAGARTVGSALVADGVKVERILGVPGSAQDAQQTAALAHQLGARWVVADGYNFGAEYQTLLKDAGLLVLVLDDYGHARRYPADIVLNQNLGASAELYPARAASTRVLLGARYVLLREEFLGHADAQRELPEQGRRVLVTMGGGDPDNATMSVLQGLQRADLPGLEVTVVAGSNYPHLDRLRQAVDQAESVTLLQGADDMPGLMAWADLGISAAGITCWEMAFMGLPNLLMVTADNQRLSADSLHRSQTAVSLGQLADVTPAQIGAEAGRLLGSADERRRLSAAGRQLIDGRGARRVLRVMQHVAAARRFPLRWATAQDSRRLWQWANDPEVRRQAFNSEAIAWEDHQRWFAGRLADPGCEILLAEDPPGTAVGQIRFDLRGGEAEVDVSLDPGYRGAGAGAVLIESGARDLLSRRPEALVRAIVKQQNIASVGAFERAGFINLGLEQLHGETVYNLTLGRGDHG